MRSQTSASEARHEPVLVGEAVALLAPRSNGVYVDCTVGLGGHTEALLAAGAGRVIAIDRDDAALAHARARLTQAADRVSFVHADYRTLPQVLAAQHIAAVDGIVADLGVSSLQLDDPARGFSFRHSGPLDMRMDRSTGSTLGELLLTTDERTLADVIFRFGEERHSRRIARAIVRARERGPIADTAALASIVRRASGGRQRQRQKIDPATRTFQALRIWVNRELDGLDDFLRAAALALRAGGRLVVIAFQSLEDRTVKHTFRAMAADGAVTLLTRRPMVPDEAEVRQNPRARSARLRALERAA